MLEFIDTVVIPFFLDLYDAIGYVGVAIAVALETFIPIIPSEVIVPDGRLEGEPVRRRSLRPRAADACAMELDRRADRGHAGAVAGSLAGYLIGAWGGRPLLDRCGRYVHIKPDDLDRADAWFARYGDWAVFFARLVPLLRALISYPAGVARMPLGRFLLFSTLGSLPWNAALLLAGYLLGENYATLYEAIRPYRADDLRRGAARRRLRHLPMARGAAPPRRSAGATRPAAARPRRSRQALLVARRTDLANGRVRQGSPDQAEPDSHVRCLFGTSHCCPRSPDTAG